VEVAVAPAFTALYAVSKELKDSTVRLAAPKHVLGRKGGLYGRGISAHAERDELRLRDHRSL